MERSSELPEANHRLEEPEDEKAREITRKWYNDTSSAGRTSSEFGALREQLRKSTTLDFEKYRTDADYRRLIHESPFLQDFLEKETLISVSMIYDRLAELGLSRGQFEKLLQVFGEGVRDKFYGQRQTEEFIKSAYRTFTPEEMAQHRKELFDTMREEIGLQERNIAHAKRNLPFFPKKPELPTGEK